jgi:RNA methyltransferase, TrmH family
VVVTSARLKEVKSLQLAKFRKELGQFVVEGEKIVLELVDQDKIKVIDLFVTQDWLSNKRMHTDFMARCTIITVAQMSMITSLKTAPSLLAVAAIPTESIDYQSDRQLAIYLDQLQDPGNVGTIMRLADWFGVEWVFASQDTADFWSPKVIQASMGAFLRVKTAKLPLEELATPHTHIMGADMYGEPIYSQLLPKNGVLVMGNEGNGISVHNEMHITKRITIPRPPEGGAESLNVATAAAIILSHLRAASPI